MSDLLIDQNSKNRKTPRSKRRVGRPEYQLNAEHEGIVRALAIYGCTVPQIAMYLKIDRKTLIKHYRHIIDTARMAMGARAVSVVGKALASSNEDRALAAAKYFLDTVGKSKGWGYRPAVPEMDPYKDLDLQRLTDREINDFSTLMTKATGKYFPLLPTKDE